MTKIAGQIHSQILSQIQSQLPGQIQSNHVSSTKCQSQLYRELSYIINMSTFMENMFQHLPADIQVKIIPEDIIKNIKKIQMKFS